MTAPFLKEEKQFLSSIVADYDEFKFDKLMRTYMMRTFDPYFPKAGKALQLGCGHGDQTTEIYQYYKDITVVDAAPQFLERVKALALPNVKVVESLFEEYETQEKFHMIMISHVLEHLIDPVAVLKRVKEFLAPGGKIFVVVPNGAAPSRQIAVQMGVLSHMADLSQADIKHGHRRVYFLDTLEKDVRLAGLTIEQRGGVFFKPLANFQLEELMGGPLLSQEFMEGCYRLGFHYPTLCASIYTIASF
jgi:2-polyprenyl-3-methyl-5-hydroxy-6-metoxy-1,4-benzoquinol methylase